jgi:hypothetical protein
VLFWDRFVLALYFGLAQHLPVGRNTALRIFDRAVAQGRLTLSALNDTSLLLLLALAPTSSPHRQTVLGLATSRALLTNSIGLIQHLRDAALPRLNDILEISRAPDWQIRQLVFDALCEPNQLGLVEDVCLYLSRHYLLDASGLQLRNLAIGLVGQAARRYVRIPLGTIDFQASLYQLVRQQALSPPQPPPTVFPPGPRPGWFVGLDAGEQHLIDTCLLYLSLQDVDVLYLSVYARLTVAQMTVALNRPPPGAGDAIVHQLEACWNAVL